jgi:hypothetical protein
MEHEKSIIPAIVTRCIQEVELRGEILGACCSEVTKLTTLDRNGYGRNLS